LQGTDWNDYFGAREITTPAYNSDDRPGFSDVELQDIIIIWRGVAEHFSLWEVMPCCCSNIKMGGAQ
jgi:hypothetical protein